MITEAILKIIGCGEDKVRDYFDKCDEVFELPNGFATRKGNVVHVIAPQPALSGRKLIAECRKYLNQVHKNFPVIYAPIKRDNEKAQKFAKKVGFKESKADITHIWFAHRSTPCAA